VVLHTGKQVRSLHKEIVQQRRALVREADQWR
jgi:hypothetical protein